jgi:hypothetical protein
MRRTLLLLASLAALLGAFPVSAQPLSNNAQRIVQTDGTHIDAASPLPITGTVTATMGASTQLPATLGAKAPGDSLSVTQDTTGGWTVSSTATEDKGTGASTAATFRTITSDDSPDVDHLHSIEVFTGATSTYGALLNMAVQEAGFAEGTRSVLIGGTDGTLARSLLTDTSGNLQVELPSEDRGRETGTANTLRVVEATCANASTISGTVTHDTDTRVINARTTRCSLTCQNQDADGTLKMVYGTATSACTEAGLLLNTATAAGLAGGSNSEDIGTGVVTLCAVAGAIDYVCIEKF